MNVPLSSLRDGELFAVHVSLDAETIDAPRPRVRGRGVHPGPAEAHARARRDHGPEGPRRADASRRRRRRRCRRPVPAGPRPGRPERCSSASPRTSPTKSTGVPMFVLVTRTDGTKGEASVTVTTSAGSAEAGTRLHRDEHDRHVRRRGRLAAARRDPDPPGRRARGRPDVLGLAHRCPVREARRAEPARRRSSTTTLPPTSRRASRSAARSTASRARAWCSTDLGTDLDVGNGPFTFPGTRADGLPYDVTVKTQPRNPDQVCTVSHGAGTLTGANVSDIAVHCAPPTPPPGLDPTFGSDGRVSTAGRRRRRPRPCSSSPTAASSPPAVAS